MRRHYPGVTFVLSTSLLACGARSPMESAIDSAVPIVASTGGAGGAVAASSAGGAGGAASALGSGGTGAASGVGGMVGPLGTGGSTNRTSSAGSGGVTGASGSVGSGGLSGTGGVLSRGGAPGTGGLVGTGGGRGKGGAVGTGGLLRTGGAPGMGGTSNLGGSGGTSAGGTGGTSACPPCIADTIQQCLPAGACVQSSGRVSGEDSTRCYENGVQVSMFTIPTGGSIIHSAVVQKDGQTCYLLSLTLGTSGGTFGLTSLNGGGSANGKVDASGAITVDCAGTAYPMGASCISDVSGASCTEGSCP